MIVVYGYKTRKAGAANTSTLVCPKCSNTTVRIQNYQEYYHIFMIPVIPIKRTAAFTCTSCGRSHDMSEANETYKAAYKKQRPVFPVWMFSGLVLLLVVIGLGTYNKNKQTETHKQEQNACYSTPITKGKIYQVGINDGYNIDTTTAPHQKSRLIKIQTVDNDSIYFSVGMFVRGVDEDMVAHPSFQNGFSSSINALSLAAFKKLEILNCK